MIFVCGVHGVGKTHYSQILSSALGKKHYSAGELILKNERRFLNQKKVENIDLNQNRLIDEVNAIRCTNIDFILDGHLCLINKNGQIKLVNRDIIRALKIDLLVVLVDKPSLIQERMQTRDGLVLEKDFIKSFQEKEINYAKQIGEELNIDYKIVFNKSESEKKYGKSMILPVKPEYVNKILSGEKQYEFRKRLCMENIDRIYLYATTPIKRILGEVEVLEKCSMQKQHLWELTSEIAGISADEYDKYFKNQKRACAYKLGEVVQYENPIRLEELGIHYSPQSYVYINTKPQTIEGSIR